MTDPTETVRRHVEAPATDDAFDPGAALDALLAPIGLAADDAGGRVEFLGADPVVPSALRLGGGAAIALAAKSVGMAAVHRDRGGEGQDVVADLRSAPHRLCPFYDRRWELLNGHAPASPTNVSQALGFSFHETRDGRYVMPLNPYPQLRHAAETFLGAPEAGVADAIARWDAAALRRRAVEGGSWAVEVSLVRAALWMLELGVFDLDYAREVAGTAPDHTYLDPETFTADTPLGHYQGVTDQVRMSATPGEYRTVLVPRGSSRPEWTPVA